MNGDKIFCKKAEGRHFRGIGPKELRKITKVSVRIPSNSSDILNAVTHKYKLTGLQLYKTSQVEILHIKYAPNLTKQNFRHKVSFKT